MARLPQPGGDDNTWGNILNDFLSQAHNTDGSLKSAAVTAAGAYTKPGSGIPSSDLDVATQSAIAQAASAYVKPPAGIPKTDLTSSVQTSLSSGDSAVQLGGDIAGTSTTPQVISRTVTKTVGTNNADYITDGTADDVQIQAAITAVSATGGTVLIRAGTYSLAATLTIASQNVVIRGEGYATHLQFPGQTVSPAIAMADTTQRQYIQVCDLRISNTGTANTGTGIDASHFATSRFANLYIDGVNVGISINSVDAFYNYVENVRISVGGSGAIGIRIDNGANENTVIRTRIITDASSTGVVVNAHANGLYDVDVETGALIGIDIQANAHDTTIYSPYLESNQTNIQLASGVRAVTVIGGYIFGGTTANITDNGSVGALWLNPRLQSNPYFASGAELALNMGTTPSDALLLDGTQPTSSATRDSHAIVLRGTSFDTSGHNVDWRNYVNVTTTAGSSQMFWKARTDNNSYVTKMTLGGDGTLTATNKVITGGAIQTPSATKTGNYTLTGTDSSIFGDATSGAITLTLPDATLAPGRLYRLKKIDSSANTVTVATTSSQTIDGATTYVLSNQYDSIVVLSDNANWKLFGTPQAAAATKATTSLAEDQNLIAWTYDPLFTNSSTTVTNGTVYLAAVNVRKASTATKAFFIVNTVAVTPTAGQNFIGLYNSSGTLLNSTGIDSNITSAGLNSVTLSASQSLSAGMYWVALVANAATPPAVARAGAAQSSALNANLTTSTLRFAVNGTGKTALANITPSSNTTTGAFAMWAAIA